MESETFIVLENVLAGLKREETNMRRRYRRERDEFGYDTLEQGADYETWLDRVERVLGQLRSNGYEVPTDISWRTFFSAGLAPDEAVRQAQSQDLIHERKLMRRIRHARRFAEGTPNIKFKRRARRLEEQLRNELKDRQSRRRPTRLPATNRWERGLLTEALILTDLVAASERRRSG